MEDVRRSSSARVARDLGRRGGARGPKRSGLPGSAANDLAWRLVAAAVLDVRPGRALTRMLLVPEQIELVPRRGLDGQAQVGDPPAPRRRRWPARIGDVGVLPGNAGVEVRIHAWNRAIAAFFPRVEEVPHAVLLDGAANASREIPELQEIARRAEPAILQVLRVVAADHAAGHAREENVPLDGVATGPRDDVHHRSADFRFAKSSRRGK